MHVLGFNGGFDLAHERRFVMGEDATHDASAALLRNGALFAAIEEERLTRIKHCAKFPIESIRFCADAAGISIADIDHFAFFSSERFADYYLDLIYLNRPELLGPRGYRAFFREMLQRASGVAIDASRLHFVDHHLAHAASARWGSGIDDGLIVVLDGQGETFAGLIAECRGGKTKVLEKLSVQRSLGYMYLSTIRLLGYWNGDEYKAMGLAPLGDPERFRRVFERCYRLLPEGGYSVDEAAMSAALLRFCSPRRRGDPFTREHRDIAAGLQATLETIVLHVLTHYRRATGLGALALAGGVAHNCSMNGKILKAGLFDTVFVHPASYDPGCAIGAAQIVSERFGAAPARKRLDMFLGSDVGQDLASRLSYWSELVDARHCLDIEAEVAAAIAKGAVVGWAQGRSEFGPRALGARNILADPRPAANRDYVNRCVKKREGYRPFAPAIVEERAAEFFELCDTAADHRFMGFAVPVRPEKRPLLGAVTHVDGTARVQVVSREFNPRFWKVLTCFGDLTGVPVLLSTSFNNDVEPIVETVDDAMACFLTTDIDALVIGDYWIDRRGTTTERMYALIGMLPAHVILNARTARSSPTEYHAALTSKYNADTPLSEGAYLFLKACDGRRSVSQVLDMLGADGRPAPAAQEIMDLWSRRLLALRPAGAPETRKR